VGSNRREPLTGRPSDDDVDVTGTEIQPLSNRGGRKSSNVPSDRSGIRMVSPKRFNGDFEEVYSKHDLKATVVLKALGESSGPAEQIDDPKALHQVTYLVEQRRKRGPVETIVSLTVHVNRCDSRVVNEYGERLALEVNHLLHQARRERGLTMEELADRAEVDRTYIGLLERGERRPTVAAAAKIAAALGLVLSDVLDLAENKLDESGNIKFPSSALPKVELVSKPPQRIVPREYLRPSPSLTDATGLTGKEVAEAIESAYHTLDLIDEQLLEKGTAPLASLVELANLSSILGNLLASGLAEASKGIYVRNGPHKYPDLLAADPTKTPDLEVKTALESNRPKGHLPKAGAYMTFRYVLCDRDGAYTRGKDSRGNLVSVWEARYGVLAIGDFDVSNTEGDSGKTAVIKTPAFNGMEIVYFHPQQCPAPQLLKRMLTAETAVATSEQG
jgi:transcriptional regulator with XRE-family HTH domain